MFSDLDSFVDDRSHTNGLLNTTASIIGPFDFCLPKGRHSEVAHEIHLICAHNYSRGGVGHAGVGWVMQGWGGSWRGEVGHAGVRWGGVSHIGEAWVM